MTWTSHCRCSVAWGLREQELTAEGRLQRWCAADLAQRTKRRRNCFSHHHQNLLASHPACASPLHPQRTLPPLHVLIVGYQTQTVQCRHTSVIRASWITGQRLLESKTKEKCIPNGSCSPSNDISWCMRLFALSLARARRAYSSSFTAASTAFDTFVIRGTRPRRSSRMITQGISSNTSRSTCKQRDDYTRADTISSSDKAASMTVLCRDIQSS